MLWALFGLFVLALVLCALAGPRSVETPADPGADYAAHERRRQEDL